MTSCDHHWYLATSCLHGEHEYCQRETGVLGTKTPAVCKFCRAPCVCDCHQSPGDAPREVPVYVPVPKNELETLLAVATVYLTAFGSEPMLFSGAFHHLDVVDVVAKFRGNTDDVWGDDDTAQSG